MPLALLEEAGLGLISQPHSQLQTFPVCVHPEDPAERGVARLEKHPKELKICFPKNVAPAGRYASLQGQVEPLR